MSRVRISSSASEFFLVNLDIFINLLMNSKNYKNSLIKRKIINIFFCITSLIFITSLLIALLNPDNVDFLYKEDKLIENISAGTCFGTFIFGIVLMLGNYRKKRLTFITSFIALLGFLDEISYGEGIIKIKFPFIAGVQIDSIHDLMAAVMAIKKQSNIEILHSLNLYITMILIVVISCIFLRSAFSLLLPNLSISLTEPYTLLFSSFFLFLIISQLIDVGIPFCYSLGNFCYVIEEMFELFSALSLLFVCFLVKKTAKGKLA